MKKKLIPLTANNVKLLGRTHMINDTLWCAFSGTGIEFQYTGTHLTVTLIADNAFCDMDNQARIAIYVNNNRIIDQMLTSSSQTLSVYEGEAKTITVKIIKLSESAMSTIGIKPIEIADTETLIPTAPQKHKVEFIGDSITCGYGVDDEDENHPFHTSTEDVTKAYAYKTATALDADYSMVSLSGYGIISGYTDNPDLKCENQLLPTYYNKLGFSINKFEDSIAPQNLEWDFSVFEPEVVVINLGTNDESYCNTAKKFDEFAAAYIDFLKQVREKNPLAHIFCAYGVMNVAMMPSIKTAIDNYSKTCNDYKISLIELPTQDGSLGYAASWHPTEATHKIASETATKKIKEIMHW